MKLLKMQPTFTLELPVSTEQAIRRLRLAVASDELKDHVESAGNCFDFQIESSDRRFWSPHLSLQLSDTNSGSEIFGRYSPRPEIWTMFMAIYGIMVILMFAATIFAYVQWFMGAAPWALVAVPIGLAVIGILHFASLVGQNLSADQIHLLRSRFDRSLELAFGEQLQADQRET